MREQRLNQLKNSGKDVQCCYLQNDKLPNEMHLSRTFSRRTLLPFVLIFTILALLYLLFADSMWS